MRAEVIGADTIDEAATEVLQVLKEKANTARSVSSRDNVFYFDGWDGLGASAVLRNIAQRLTATTPAGKRALADLEFDQVIHIDCSMWESRRAFQRAVAEQLKLPDEVMKLFDRQDEEDDFLGVAQGSRLEVEQVVREMHECIQKLNRRFLVIFHNGSGEEIDLASFCGFLLSGYSTSKVLWTFQGRYRIKPRTKVDKAMKSAGKTDAFVSVVPRNESQEEVWSYLVLQEAAEVAEACKVTAGSRDIIDQPAQVAECFIYMLEQCCHSIDFDLATHGTNYWVCDGIIQQLKLEGRVLSANDDSDWLWRAADALQREIALDVDYHQHFPSSHLSICVERKPYWISPNYGFNRVPGRAILNGGIFQHYLDKLRVLKLSRCTFNFQSPPFLCCQGLRFLWLDHCQDTGINTDGEGKEEDVRRCFQRLWVLDVRYMHRVHILSGQMMDYMTQLRELNVMGAWEWDMGQLQGRLPNIRKLRVTKSKVTFRCSEEDLFSKMNNLELLDFSGNNIYSARSPRLPAAITINNSSCLETVNIGENRALEGISFKGCTKLKNLIFSGWLYDVRAIDISGTAVKTLDLTAATTINNLNELYLLDCKKLCAILWPPKRNMKQDIDMLCIDTTRSAPTAQSREEIAKRGTTTAATIGTSAATTVLHRSRPTNEFPWYISVRDARLLMSLEAVYSDSRELYLEVSPTPSPTVFAAVCRDDEGIKSGSSSELQRQPAPAIYAATGTTAKCDGDAPGIMWLWSCPDVPDLGLRSSYIHIQETNTITVPRFVIDCAKILHVRDSMSITVFPSGTSKYQGSEWHQLEWCRIERCPRLEDVFTPRGPSEWRTSHSMKTFWASQLRKASCIWKWSEPYGASKFPYLVFLHLDCCPRLVHVLPLSIHTIAQAGQLETLEITWCGDLREVFPVDTIAKRYVKLLPQPFTVDFPGLKRIHLHELPRLHSICGVRMSAPNLETVKIRGCWSLRRLPDVGDGDKAVECDCEKEWWDRLEWDDGSQVTRYKPIHSRYYKKTLLRSSVLR
ncbi:hypothetical protein SETIT_2G058500v2 [Setaria italica]|uniref:Disease resistance protein At4g27190-like leucine-rich repeats domain-containing protein n=1 Tax=Setaria italica TaxID=4555 RepID=K3ZQC0_SETIT|nr:uncharacterized protein LOC101775597 [Setaria italica]XP_004955670.1 uncharacterized protein LOC101775597 [Setaria italica]RCV09795.1 hypothetical protein SETIT_2G058500v2 [Setaria italica]